MPLIIIRDEELSPFCSSFIRRLTAEIISGSDVTGRKSTVFSVIGSSRTLLANAEL